ncbi:Uma2 family endonuclease [Actinomadura rudentiformis]|uniref:Uma2 family endonuclease n=1 Tax=Actinomadura rudentiformis TaxID=359158 RepID=A0A6H9YSP7_9ACTN|nr:Uma2 family endonuclease [Actinomadura rudentiformis]KAB2343348.1 Uma2 family endonuclease [Actinomadura rudentiformis]
MSEGSPDVNTTAEHIGLMDLPDTAYNLWVRGELDDLVHAPEGHRVEIIGGRIVVSPPPSIPHGGIVQDISDAFTRARDADNAFAWTAMQVAWVNQVGTGEGYIPDLVVLDAATYLDAREEDLSMFAPDELELVVEVTSKKGADNDRPPEFGPSGRPLTKWSYYAKAEVPYYLLADRSPKAARTTLYTIPDQGSAAYLHEESWAFGETIHLPEPFDLRIDTSRWKPWKVRQTKENSAE